MRLGRTPCTLRPVRRALSSRGRPRPPIARLAASLSAGTPVGIQAPRTTLPHGPLRPYHPRCLGRRRWMTRSSDLRGASSPPLRCGRCPCSGLQSCASILGMYRAWDIRRDSLPSGRGHCRKQWPSPAPAFLKLLLALQARLRPSLPAGFTTGFLAAPRVGAALETSLFFCFALEGRSLLPEASLPAPAARRPRGRPLRRPLHTNRSPLG